jgi:hypothetical protein
MEDSHMRRSLILPAAAVLTLVAAPTAAQESSPVASDGASSTAMVRVLHASPDAPAVDIYLDGARVGDPLADLAFGTISPYVEVPSGTHALKVSATADPTVCPIDVPELTLEPGSRSTVAATDLLAAIKAQVVTDGGAPDPTQALVRFVHLSADAPAVDVLTQEGDTVAAGLAYPNATDYLALAPGSYDLKVCAAADHTVCPIDPPAVDLSAGQVVSVFAIGSLAGGTITALVAPDADVPANMSPAPSPGI